VRFVENLSLPFGCDEEEEEEGKEGGEGIYIGRNKGGRCGRGGGLMNRGERRI